MDRLSNSQTVISKLETVFLTVKYNLNIQSAFNRDYRDTITDILLLLLLYDMIKNNLESYKFHQFKK